MVAWPVFVSALLMKIMMNHCRNYVHNTGTNKNYVALFDCDVRYLIRLYSSKWFGESAAGFIDSMSINWEFTIHIFLVPSTVCMWLWLWFIAWLVCRTIFVCVLLRVIFNQNANRKKHGLTEHHKICGSFVWAIEQPKSTFTLIEHLYDICFTVSEFEDCCSTRKYMFLFTQNKCL